MALFNRQWFEGLQRMFPSSTQMLPYPRELTDTVSFTKDLQARDFVNNIRLRRSVLVDNGPIASILDFPQPDEGFFQVPVAMSFWHTDSAAAMPFTFAIVITGDPLDPWGQWDTTTRLIWTGDIPAAPAGRFRVITTPIIMPLPRGALYRVEFPVVPAGAQVRAHYYWLDVPGDLMKFDDLFRASTITGPVGV